MKKLLIRAEDKNIWERRAPIVPDDLKDIIEQTHAQAFVEQSPNGFSRPMIMRLPVPFPARGWLRGR